MDDTLLLKYKNKLCPNKGFLLNKNAITKQQAIAIREIDGQPTMSSLRIAEVTGKSHGAVLKSIDAIFLECGIGQAKFDSTYIDGSSRETRHYLLPEREFNLVVSGYSVKYRLQLIDELMSYRNETIPTSDKIEVSKFSDAAKIMPDAKAMAELFGLKGNQALLSANRATKEITTIDIIKVMNIQLVSETKEQIYTPTEIGKAIKEPKLGAIAVNKILQALGLQLKAGKHWQPTEKGMEFAEMLDTGKKHSDGTPVKQLKWKHCVLKLIEE